MNPPPLTVLIIPFLWYNAIKNKQKHKKILKIWNDDIDRLKYVYNWYIENDIPNIVCVQPFACLPNHVVGKGVIKTIREKYPEANISPVDYDPGASEANQTNRIKLLMTVAKDNLEMKQKIKQALENENVSSKNKVEETI